MSEQNKIASLAKYFRNKQPYTLHIVAIWRQAVWLFQCPSTSAGLFHNIQSNITVEHCYVLMCKHAVILLTSGPFFKIIFMVTEMLTGRFLQLFSSLKYLVKKDHQELFLQQKVVPVKSVQSKVCELSEVTRTLFIQFPLNKTIGLQKETISDKKEMVLGLMQSTSQRGLYLCHMREYNVPLLLQCFHPGLYQSIFHPRLHHSLSILLSISGTLQFPSCVTAPDRIKIKRISRKTHKWK